MRLNRLIYLLLMLFLLSGCEVAKWLESSPEDLRLAATVREEVERIEADQAAARRQYIAQFIDRKFEATSGRDEKRIGVVEQKVDALVARMETLARYARSAGMTLSSDRSTYLETEQIETLKADIRTAVRAIAEIVEKTREHDATMNARFERLEFRTRTVTWPRVNPTISHGLHLASYRSHESALRGWEALIAKYPIALKGQDPILIEVETVAGSFVRLMTGAKMSDPALVRVRNQVREGGDYAMIMPLRITGKGAGTKSNKVAPGS